MATFSENQVRHLFVATAETGSTLGAMVPKCDAKKENLWFEYMGKGGKVRTDIIPLANIVSTKATKSDSMKRPLDKFKVQLDASIQGQAGAEIVAGLDYILRLAFRNYIGMSDEDQYWKYGMVHGTLGMTSDVFYKTLVNSILINVARDDNKLLKVFVHSAVKGANKSNSTTGTAFSEGVMEVTKAIKNFDEADNANPYYVGGDTLVDDIDYILLEEVEQPWVLGKIAVGKIPFVAQTDFITVGGDEIKWGVVTKETPTSFILNGKEIADLEHFCMGERGDLYRGMGYPNNIITEYMVDASKTYDTIDITYFYAGPNEDIQKSQKVLTIVMDDSGSNAIEKALAGAINTATGKTTVEVFA